MKIFLWTNFCGDEASMLPDYDYVYKMLIILYSKIFSIKSKFPIKFIYNIFCAKTSKFVMINNF